MGVMAGRVIQTEQKVNSRRAIAPLLFFVERKPRNSARRAARREPRSERQWCATARARQAQKMRSGSENKPAAR